MSYSVTLYLESPWKQYQSLSLELHAQLYVKNLKDRATKFRQQAKVVENRNTKGLKIWAIWLRTGNKTSKDLFQVLGSDHTLERIVTIKSELWYANQQIKKEFVLHYKHMF